MPDTAPVTVVPAPTSPYAPIAYPPAAARPAAADGSVSARALGIGSLVLGVLAVVGAAVPIVNLASAGLAVAGTGLGIAALFLLSRGRGVALAGTITSVVALVVSVALALVYSGLIAAATSAALFSGGYVDESVKETIAPIDDAAGAGTFDAPVALGETVVVTRDGEARWEITLTSATYDALGEVEEANAGVDVEGDLDGGLEQYAYLSAEITYLGEGSTPLSSELYVAFAPTAHVFYYTGEVPARAPGTDLALTDDIASGETVSGNFLVALPPAAEATGRWTVSGEWTDSVYIAAE
ncbi:hypothetical protein ELQ90_09855 [Labedella phragmitis]|uniref:DUF4190 domain-containing protein n=1 Tax=Labedella phragmitis TaxID=2498849 RepID=A0A3S3ZQ55_9MICO|nr:hypothetical protein [Labedella phragmitis]RWZ51087.1 hypothetical protein ELQ90_09855 [Labedella phragmitis]